MSTLIFDTETTGFKPLNVAQIAALLYDDNHNEVASFTTLIQPGDGWTMSKGAFDVHGISMEMMERYGIDRDLSVRVFDDMLSAADVVVAHNLTFDKRVMKFAYSEAGSQTDNPFADTIERCTMKTATPICQLPSKNKPEYKWPSLAEATKFFFNEELVDAHDALVDTRACARIYFELLDGGAF